MSNELTIVYPTGSTLYAHLFDATGQIWNGGAFAAPASANWQDYDIAMSEVATATGIYRGNMPAVAAGVYSFVVRKQTGGSPAVADISVGAGEIEWSGSAAVALADVATALADVPTNAELASALASADDAVLAAIAALNNLSQANVRTAVGLASANLDTQLSAINALAADVPTNAELAAALAGADDAVLAAIAALNNLSAAQINAEVVDALSVDTYAQPGQGAPAATVSLALAIGYLYKAMRNCSTTTATQYSLRSDDGVTIDQKAVLSYDGTTFTRGEMTTGA